MAIRSTTKTVTTDASGDATAYTSVTIIGKLLEIHYTKTDYTDGVDFTITHELTGENLWVESNVNASTVRRPRAPTHDQAGVASLYAAAGEPVEDKIALYGRIKIVIASGGDTKTGAFRIFYET